MKSLPNALRRLTPIPALLTVLIAIVPAAAAVKISTPVPQETLAITEFKFEVLNNPGMIAEDIVADIYGDTLIVGIIPFQQNEFNLRATFLATGAESTQVAGVDQESTITINDFSSPVSYVVSGGGETKTYNVRLVYTGLPVVYIYTEDSAPVESKDNYVNGTIKIYPNVEDVAILNSEMGIRGRGNTTWTFPKKPYKVKLGSAASVLGMPSDKEWVLLANYSDKSLMRNSIAYHLGSEMNFAYTPRTTHVDLILNGVYQGNYLIGEHIKVDKDRVNIEELTEEDTDESVINGGYFLELDDYRDGTYFELKSGLPFVVKSPDDVTDQQLDFVNGYMQETEDAIFSPDFSDPENGYAKYIEPGTFIEWYWVNEVMKNIDAQDVSSIYYYKNRDAKLNMGPLWDLDVAAGNASVNTGDDPTSFYVRESKWFKRLFEDSTFKIAAEARWFTFRDELLSKLPDYIDSMAEVLNTSQQQNFYKWDILNQPIFPSTLVHGSYENEIVFLKEWLSTRIAWIDSHIAQPDTLGIPQLDFPANGTVVENLLPTIRWYSANLADGYDVQVSTTENFEILVVTENALSDTTYLLTEPLTEQTTYYWRTRAVNANEEGTWSEVWSFTTPTVLGTGDVNVIVSLFPNPAGDELFIDVPSFASVDNAELVDALGRTAVTSGLQPGATTKIDVSHLRRGLYVVILRGSMEKPLMSKVILR